MAQDDGVNRRDFVRTAVGVGSVAGAPAAAVAAKPAAGRVVGANERINIRLAQLFLHDELEHGNRRQIIHQGIKQGNVKKARAVGTHET